MTKRFALPVFVWIMLTCTAVAFLMIRHGSGQGPPVDPGLRTTGTIPGGALSGLSAGDAALFASARNIFQRVDSVSGAVPGEPGSGLGPAFNLNSCSGCHSQPAIGGSSPATNPQVAMATDAGASNTIPSFITLSGPVREARFIHVLPGTNYDGQVHPLYVITTRSDNPSSSCTQAQPDFVTNLSNNNVIFRIPTPMFGAGFIESTSDAALIAAQNVSRNTSLAITSGYFNYSGDTGQILRFGWKAQHPSLLSFAGEAYVNEMGVTNNLFPNKRQIAQPACAPNRLPEDAPVVNSAGTPTAFSDIDNFALFAQRLAAPVAASSGYTAASATVTSAQISQGATAFHNVGCDACHIPTQTTGSAVLGALNNATYSPYSDFALHGMGSTLADNIVQGQANGDAFRTAPLWGLGQRIFFLHDGRETNLYNVILDHSSTGSEATQVLNNFNAATSSDQQALLYFLRSL